MSYYKKGHEPLNRRYILIAEDDSDIYKDTKTHEILSDFVILERLNEQEEEIQVLKRYIERNMISRITIEDVLACARDMRFYDNEEIVKAIDCIAKDLGVDLD